MKRPAPSTTVQKRQDLREHMAQRVLRYLWWILLLVAGIQLFNILHALVYTGWRLHTPASRVYVLLYACLLVVSLLGLACVPFLKRSLPRSAGLTLWLQWIYCGFLLCWAVMVTLYDQRVGPGAETYLTVLLTVAVLAELPPVPAAVLLGVPQIALMLALPHYQPTKQDNFGLYLNSTVLAAVAIFIACYRYLSQKRQHEGAQLILEKNREIAEKNRELMYLVGHDSLTGLYNRRFLDLRLPAICADCAEHGKHLGMMMIDIDDFKLYNDQFGHQMGDACLDQVSQALLGCLQSEGEYILRYGGEEFLYLGSGADTAAVRRRGEEMCAAVRALALHAAGKPSPVTVSIGACAAVPQDKSAWQTLIRRADQALYTAKHQGKDQVVCDTGEGR